MNKLEQATRQALEALREYRDTQMISAPRKAIEALREALNGQAECKECGAKQAQIDRLMLEYCPDEMTLEQMQEYGKNQRPVEQAEQEPTVSNGVCGGCAKKAADGWALYCVECWEKAKQEPVAVVEITYGREPECYVTGNIDDFPEGVFKLYAAPVRTKDLTDDEIMKINVDTASIVPTCDRQFHFARAVIAADREKNK